MKILKTIDDIDQEIADLNWEAGEMAERGYMLSEANIEERIKQLEKLKRRLAQPESKI